MKAHRKLLAMLLALVLCCTALPTLGFRCPPTYKSWDGTSDVSWYNDTDTEFHLTTAEQLAGLAEIVNGGNTMAGKTIYLDADLDLAGHEWRSIGIGSNHQPILRWYVQRPKLLHYKPYFQVQRRPTGLVRHPF